MVDSKIRFKERKWVRNLEYACDKAEEIFQKSIGDLESNLFADV